MKQALVAAVLLVLVLAAIRAGDYHGGLSAPGPTVEGLDWSAVAWAALPWILFAGAVVALIVIWARSDFVHLAAERGDIRALTGMLDKHPDLVNDARSGSEMRPLHLAARRGYAEVARLLLSRGAEPDARDASGRTALYYAAAWGYRDVVEVLLAAGAAVTKDGPEDTQPIAAAEYWKHAEIAALLRARG